MPRIGVICPVDKAKIDDETCLACKISSRHPRQQTCNLAYEMLRGSMDSSGRTTAHLSATTLTNICPRKVRLELETDFFGRPEKMFHAWRGTIGHLAMEAYPEPGCIYEQRFEVLLDLPNGTQVIITGKLDKLAAYRGHIGDGKTKEDVKLARLSKPDAAHVLQLNIYRWLVWHGWPQSDITTDAYGNPLPNGLILAPGVRSELEITSLELVYFSMAQPKPLPAPLMDLDEVEEIVIAKALELTGPELPAVPLHLDPWNSTFCKDWCPVRDACIAATVGF